MMIKGKLWRKRPRKEPSFEQTQDDVRGDIQLLTDFYKRGVNSSPLPKAQQEEGVLDVVIVGAGWAGIAAAMTLQAKGIENFRILEARDYVGGGRGRSMKRLMVKKSQLTWEVCGFMVEKIILYTTLQL